MPKGGHAPHAAAPRPPTRAHLPRLPGAYGPHTRIIIAISCCVHMCVWDERGKPRPQGSACRHQGASRQRPAGQRPPQRPARRPGPWAPRARRQAGRVRRWARSQNWSTARVCGGRDMHACVQDEAHHSHSRHGAAGQVAARQVGAPCMGRRQGSCAREGGGRRHHMRCRLLLRPRRSLPAPVGGRARGKRPYAEQVLQPYR